VVYRFFEGRAGLPHLAIQQTRDIVIQREGGPHIMMLAMQTS
jgi:hypothetical protein